MVPLFHTGVPKIMTWWCTVSEIWCATDGWKYRQTAKVTYRGECPTWKYLFNKYTALNIISANATAENRWIFSKTQLFSG